MYSVKIFLLLAAFFFGLFPYVFISMFNGIHDVIYFLIVWAIFLFASKLSQNKFTLVAVLCGFVLALPLSTFFYVDQTQAFFFIEGLKRKLQLDQLSSALGRAAYFTALMLIASFAIRGLRRSR